MSHFYEALDWIDTVILSLEYSDSAYSRAGRRENPMGLVDGHSEDVNFLALSYVWGPSSGQTGAKDHDHIGQTEVVVEDAMSATIALGYTYLWVDRHCITVEDENVQQQQLLNMMAVYENSEVTIVVAAGKGFTFGIPGVSRARIPQPYTRIRGHILTATLSMHGY
ncbi:hypothetical protein QQX98_010698 [Neonectria punicea]|uniref:Heterokaryon incompatibility domain-containing protein n=1 Tax=Neonectria punicea TaxID=979145 RepID=A0ABR1GP46_9HYPO